MTPPGFSTGDQSIARRPQGNRQAAAAGTANRQGLGAGVAVALGLAPGVAAAQRIPTEIAVAAVSPLLVLLLVILLGILARSWRLAARHAGLVLLWLLLAFNAAWFFDNDLIVWTPLLLYAAHGVLIVALVIAYAFRRIRGSADRDSP